MEEEGPERIANKEEENELLQNVENGRKRIKKGGKKKEKEEAKNETKGKEN